MLRRCQAEVTIRKVENGYVIEWEKEKPKQPKWANKVSSYDEDDLWNPTGIEIVVKPADMMKRVKELIG